MRSMELVPKPRSGSVRSRLKVLGKRFALARGRNVRLLGRRLADAGQSAAWIDQGSCDANGGASVGGWGASLAAQRRSGLQPSAGDERISSSELRDQARAAAERSAPRNDAATQERFENAQLSWSRTTGRSTTAVASGRLEATAWRSLELVDASALAIEGSCTPDSLGELDDVRSGSLASSGTPGILDRLPGAAARGELALHYQPLRRLSSGELVGFEALLRWTSPDLGVVPPDEFIPVAERFGLIVEIGDWVIATALTALAKWRSCSPQDELSVAVNIAPEQLTVPAFAENLARTLRERGVPPEALTLEVTERTLITDTPALHRAMQQLREIGVQMSVDDFGTGFSSLGRLASLPLDEVKIDRVFVSSLTVDCRQRALVAGILAMAAALDLRVVAEGIETPAQHETLVELGCELAQGYFLGRPGDHASTTALVGRLQSCSPNAAPRAA